MILVDLILAALVYGLVMLWVKRKNPTPPSPMTEVELISAGYSYKEAKREARAQRAEQRSSIGTTMQGMRTADRLFRTSRRVVRRALK